MTNPSPVSIDRHFSRFSRVSQRFISKPKTSRKMRNERVGVRIPCRLSSLVILPILGSIHDSAYTMVWLVGFVSPADFLPQPHRKVGRVSDTDPCL